MQNKFEKLILSYLVIVSVLLSAGFIYLFYKIENPESPSNTQVVQNTSNEEGLVDSINVPFGCDSFCKAEIKKIVDESLAKSNTVKEAPAPAPTAKPTSVPSAKQTAYVPFTGPITSTSTDWADASGTDISIDLKNDYSESAVATWQATIKIANGNGQVFARLFDVTHGIAVAGSEVSSTNNADYLTVTSGNLSFWSGKNTYRVQIKSLNSFVATFGSGRIKIVY